MIATESNRTTGKKRIPRKPRARPITQWLDFIRPHVDRYGQLPRGERKKYIEELSNLAGTSVNTLRRFIAAAQYLEGNGIREFPKGVTHMPVASIESIMRIGKHDPEHARYLLGGLGRRHWTIRRLRAELEATPPVSPSPDPTIDRITEEKLRAVLCELAGSQGSPFDASDLYLMDFEFWDMPLALFDRLAYPVAIAQFPDGRRAAIFDEAAVKWKVSPDRAKREFLRNVSIATSMFALVLVFCSGLDDDVLRLGSALSEDCGQKLFVRRGVLDLGELRDLRFLAG